MTFYLAFAVVVVALSGLVIMSDARDRRRRLESKIRAHSVTAAQREWDGWSDMVRELIEASSPPEERDARIEQFIRDHPRPGGRKHDGIS